MFTPQLWGDKQVCWAHYCSFTTTPGGLSTLITLLLQIRLSWGEKLVCGPQLAELEFKCHFADSKPLTLPAQSPLVATHGSQGQVKPLTSPASFFSPAPALCTAVWTSFSCSNTLGLCTCSYFSWELSSLSPSPGWLLSLISLSLNLISPGHL